MPPELDSNPPNPEAEAPTKQFSDEEIQKILNTAKATRQERDAAAAKAKDLEDQNRTYQQQLEQAKAIDPTRYKQLEEMAATLEERKLEEQRQFSELKERWTEERTGLQKQIQSLQDGLKTTQITNALEKSFYAFGGRSGKDDFGCSYFDLIRERAMSFIKSDEGKITIIDPRDGTRMLNDKGAALSLDDLMIKLRSAGPTAALFEAVNNGSGSGMTRSRDGNSLSTTREQLMQLPRAERLAKARELGIK